MQAAHDAIKGAVHCTPVMTCHQMDALCPGDSRQLFFKVSACRERESGCSQAAVFKVRSACGEWMFAKKQQQTCALRR